MQNKKRSLVFLLLIIVLGFVVRLYRFDNPIADWHSWRQADTSAVSRNFVTNGFDLLHPTFEDLSNVPSGKENPNGYRFVEFPVYNVLQAGLFKSIGVLTLEEWGRLITIFSSLATAIFLYGIVKRHVGTLAGLLTAGFFTFLPYNIYYDRTILPDVSMSMAITGAIFFFDKWINSIVIPAPDDTRGQAPAGIQNAGFSVKLRMTKWFFLSIFFTTIALLLKPYAIIFALPIVWLAFEAFGLSLWKKWQFYAFAFVSITPLVLWRLWMRQYPEGIPASAWLLNGDGIRFRPAFFRWIVFERLTKLISGYIGIWLLAIGFWHIVRRKDWFFLSFLFSSILYICILATGNVKHDYYQILIMPTVAILMGLGSYYFLRHSGLSRISHKRSWMLRQLPDYQDDGKVERSIRYTLFSILCLILFYFSWGQVKDYFNINNPAIVVAGAAVDRLTPKNAKVIANLEGDTSFLYETKRQGWPSFEHDLPVMIKLGADYLVLANPKPADLAFGNTYKIVAETPQYIIFDLHKKP